jgi:hypothetical protein
MTLFFIRRNWMEALATCWFVGIEKRLKWASYRKNMWAHTWHVARAWWSCVTWSGQFSDSPNSWKLNKALEQQHHLHLFHSFLEEIRWKLAKCGNTAALYLFCPPSDGVHLFAGTGDALRAATSHRSSSATGGVSSVRCRLIVWRIAFINHFFVVVVPRAAPTSLFTVLPSAEWSVRISMMQMNEISELIK